MDAQNEEKANKDEKIYKIIFEKKNTKANIKMGINLGIILIIALIVVSTFFNFIIKYRYGDVIEELKDKKNNNNGIILDYTKIIAEVSKSIVTIGQEKESTLHEGEASNNITGVIITENGLILTNYSAIKDFNDVYVRLAGYNDEVLKGNILIKNEKYDLALVEIEYEGMLEPIKIADSNDVVEGQGIAVLGNIYIDNNKIDSIVPGIITSRYELSKDTGVDYNLIQISAPVTKENTGGPICNAKGELIGIASLYLSNKYNLNGLYYGVELNELENNISSTIEIRDALGITEGGLLLADKSSYKGFYVGQLQKGGNAYKAGIKPTDIIISIDGHDIISTDEVTEILSAKNKDDSINCKVLSDGEIKDIEIKLYNIND